jgi:hypothetical protein
MIDWCWTCWCGSHQKTIIILSANMPKQAEGHAELFQSRTCPLMWFLLSPESTVELGMVHFLTIETKAR